MDAHQAVPTEGDQAETRKKTNNTSTSSHLVQEKMESVCSPAVSLELLKTCGNRKRLSGVKLIEKTSATPCNTSSGQAVSTEGIMRMARAKLLQYASPNSDIFSIIVNSPNSHSGLSSELDDDVELALLLQASAEKVANHQFGCARKLLSMCDISASPAGNLVQRVVHYFAEALREKIDQETGVISPGQGEEKKQIDFDNILTSQQPSLHELPFTLATEFPAIQAILDNLGSANRIHLIDLGIRNGAHWIVLLQALTVRYEFPVEHLKISAVGTYRSRIEMAGERLTSFAQTMKLPFSFSFKVVESDSKELKKDLFELENGEAVAVYSDLRLGSMLTWPSHLEALIRVIKSLNPCVMVVIESEMSTNQLSFLDRFYQYLFSASALFDCIDTCMEGNNRTRKIAESVYLRAITKDVIAAEGENRIYRHENIDFWRAFFARFGIVETELSESSLYRASLVLKQSARWSSCTLEMNGHCLIMKWKGTPLQSVSAWKVSAGGKT